MDKLGLKRLRCWLLSLPTIRTHGLSMTVMNRQRSVVVEITDTQGRTGFGEAATIGGMAYGHDGPETIKAAIDHYARPAIVDGNYRTVAEHMQVLDAAIAGGKLAKSAVETALLDLAGQAAGQPISSLLGGAFHNRLPVLWVLASGDTDEDIEEARQHIKSGRHSVFKLKVGRRPWSEDAVHIRAICEALGDKAEIRIDVNQAWDLPTAKQAIPRLVEWNVRVVEQPLQESDLIGARELRELGAPCVLADEAIDGPASAFAVARMRAADAVSLKIGTTGGPRSLVRTAHVAAAGGCELFGGTLLEAGLATVASAHACAAIESMTLGTELFGPLLLREDILEEPLAYVEGQLLLPTGPGLGVSPSPVALREFCEIQSE